VIVQSLQNLFIFLNLQEHGLTDNDLKDYFFK
jgi:hypothetical protein